MAEKYIDLLAQCAGHFLFFSKERADAKAEDAKKEGNKAEIYRERDQWTVFIIERKRV
jgi:hypothetical protein